jgi:hypothetical protein
MRNPMLGGALALGIGMVGLIGCKSDDGGGTGSNGSGLACMPGTMVSCGCPTNATLMKSCLPDGSGYQPCMCPGAAGMGAAGMMGAGSGGQMAPGTGGMGAMIGAAWAR